MPFRRTILAILATLAFATAASTAFGLRDVRFSVTNSTNTPLSVSWWPDSIDLSPSPPKVTSIRPGETEAITGSAAQGDDWDLVSLLGRRWTSRTILLDNPFGPRGFGTGSRTICLAGRNPTIGTPTVAGGGTWEYTGTAAKGYGKICTTTPEGQAFSRQLTAGKKRIPSTQDFSINGITGTVHRVADSTAFIEYEVTIRTLPAIPDYPITVAVNDPSRGRVVGTATTDIDCGTRCTAQVRDDTDAQLRAIPAPGFRLSSWDGSCARSGTDDDCTMRPITDPRGTGRDTPVRYETTATFEPIPPQTLSLTTAGAGSGRITSNPAGLDCGPSTTCTAQFLTGATVTLRAFADPESTFGAWTGPCAGSGDTCTVTLSAATQVGATFNQRPNVTVAASVTGSGLVRGDGGLYCRVPPSTQQANRCTVSYPRNASITLTAEQVDPALPFTGWSAGAPGCGTVATCTPGLWASIAPVAAFSSTPLRVRVRKTGTGSGRVTGPLNLDCGTTCGVRYVGSPLVPLQFTATPDPGSSFTRWEGTCKGTNGTCRTMLTGEAVAVFTADPPPPTAQLVVVRQGDGRGTVMSDPTGINCGLDCSGTFDTASTVALRARADASSIFARWEGSCAGTATSCSVSMDASRTAVAVFEPAPAPPTDPVQPPGPAPAPLVVPEPGPNPPSPDVIPSVPTGAPGLRALAVSRRSFRPGQGTVIRYRLDYSADVTMTFTYGKARRPRYRYVAKKDTAGGDAGANAVRIIGRVRNRNVAHGRWTMRITARNANGSSRPVSRVLTVK
jgi:hypothetical protein